MNSLPSLIGIMLFVGSVRWQYIYIYGHFAFLANIGHSSVGQRHNPPTNSSKSNIHQRSIDLTLVRGGLGFETQLMVVQWLLYLFCLSGQNGSNHPTMAVAVLLRRKYVSSTQRRMRALIKALDPLDQFKRPVAYSDAIITFQSPALLLRWAGDASLHDDDNVVKQTIVTAIPMATNYRSISLV